MNKTRIAASLISVFALFALTTGCVGTSRAERSQHVAESWSTNVIELQERLGELSAKYRALPDLEQGVLLGLADEKAQMERRLEAMELQRREIARSGEPAGVRALGDSMLELHRDMDALRFRIIDAGLAAE